MNSKELEQLGLTKNESKTYLALLSLNSTNADPIIKKTGLHRNIVYDNLDKLMKKGLVSHVIRNNRKYFETTQPYQLIEWVRKRKQEIIEKEQIAQSLIPEIENIRKLSKENKEAAIFTGIKSIMGLMMEMIEEGNFDMFASGYGMRIHFPTQYKVFNARIKQKKRKVRAIVPEDFRKYDQGTVIPRFLPNDFMPPTNTSIAKDKVNIFIFDEEPIAIQLRSKHIAQAYQSHFNLMWSMAKK